jgi:hypothetical protein
LNRQVQPVSLLLLEVVAEAPQQLQLVCCRQPCRYLCLHLVLSQQVQQRRQPVSQLPQVAEEAPQQLAYCQQQVQLGCLQVLLLLLLLASELLLLPPVGLSPAEQQQEQQVRLVLLQESPQAGPEGGLAQHLLQLVSAAAEVLGLAAAQ